MLKEIKFFIAKYWLVLFFIFLVIFYLISDLSISDIKSQLYKLNFWQLCILILISFMSMGIHIFSRYYLLDVIGARCSFKNNMYIYFLTLAANYSTPVKIGYPVAIYLFNKFENVPYPKSTAMLFLELVISTSFCGIIAFFGISIIWGNSISSDLLRMTIFIIALTAIILLTGKLLLKYFSKNRIGQAVKDFTMSIKQISLLHFILYSFLILLLRVTDSIGLWLITNFISEPITLWQAIVSSSSAFFIGSISMIPMGIGSRDISLIFYLQHYGLSDAAALIVVTAQRILSTGLTFILGLFFGSILGIKNMMIFNESNNKY